MNYRYDCVLKRLTDTRFLKCEIHEGMVYFYIEVRQYNQPDRRVTAMFRHPTSLILSHADDPWIRDALQEAFSDPVFEMFGLVWGVPQ